MAAIHALHHNHASQFRYNIICFSFCVQTLNKIFYYIFKTSSIIFDSNFFQPQNS